MEIFDYTEQGRRPSARQIVSDWRKAGRPDIFQAEYGETFAHFEKFPADVFVGRQVRWFDSGNGCTGIKRAAVVELLERECAVIDPNSPMTPTLEARIRKQRS